MSNHAFTVKGAAWFNDHDLCRSAIRYFSEPDNRHYDTGLRLGLDLGQSSRAIRGGSWIDNKSLARSAYRYFRYPEGRYSSTGIRLAMSIEP